jgi:predicted DCC family thiol-disulfide oxidoreductase YuxK
MAVHPQEAPAVRSTSGPRIERHVGLIVLWLSAFAVAGMTLLWARHAMELLATLPFPLTLEGSVAKHDRAVRGLVVLGTWYARNADAVDREAIAAGISGFARRVCVFAFAAATVATLFVRVRSLRTAPKAFFTEPGSATDLAIFRVLYFTLVLWWVDSIHPLEFAALPPRLRVGLTDPLPLWHVLVPSPGVMTVALWTLRASCVLAALGLFTRAATIGVVLSGFYVLGLPEMFGQVMHFHHVLWFAALLAASPCGDALGVDAVVSALRRADRGDVEPVRPSIAYSRPLRMTWLVLALVYFFPGLWKSLVGGASWFTSESLANEMRLKWFEAPWFRPLFRADLSPRLLLIAGAGTIAFELGFAFLVLFRRTRPLVPFAGLGFHNMTRALMNIPFWNLQIVYVTFVPWARCFLWLGDKLFPEPLVVAFDGSCRMCRRTIAVARSFDVLGRCTYVDVRDAARLRGVPALSAVSPEGLLADIHGVVGHRVVRGVDLYKELFKRVPAFWPVAPLLVMPPFEALARSVYRRVADGRHCSIPVAMPSLAPPPTASAVTLVGVLLMCPILTYGFARKVAAWPFACYPTFDGFKRNHVQDLVVTTDDASGVEHDVSDEPLRRSLGPEKVTAMKNAILDEENPGRQAALLRSFWTAVEQARGGDQVGREVRFYRAVVSVVPEAHGERVVSATPLLTMGR